MELNPHLNFSQIQNHLSYPLLSWREGYRYTNNRIPIDIPKLMQFLRVKEDFQVLLEIKSLYMSLSYKHLVSNHKLNYPYIPKKRKCNLVCILSYESSAYNISFHVSGTPGRHQWLQSVECPSGCWASSSVRAVTYTEGWPSRRRADITVISWRCTGNLILLNTPRRTNSCSGRWGCRRKYARGSLWL